MEYLARRIATALDGKTPEQIKAEMEINGSRLNLLSRQLKVYHKAVENAPEPLVGVGCITFADQRVAVFNRRVGRLVMRRLGL